MITESPPVSPSALAAILMIQKTSVTSETLVAVSLQNSLAEGVNAFAPSYIGEHTSRLFIWLITSYENSLQYAPMRRGY